MVSVLRFKSTKPGVGCVIVSLPRNKNHVKIGPLIGCLRNKGVLSLAEALPVYRRPWVEPRACSGVLAPLAEGGHNKSALSPFSLRF